jgi:hypothetical protein
MEHRNAGEEVQTAISTIQASFKNEWSDDDDRATGRAFLLKRARWNAP